MGTPEIFAKEIFFSFHSFGRGLFFFWMTGMKHGLYSDQWFVLFTNVSQPIV
jgi:hypothetical protein